jgi:hypothetical protein
MITPIRKPCAPKCRLYTGISGTTIPNPIRSMKTVRKITKTDGFLMRKPSKTRGPPKSRHKTTSPESMGARFRVKRAAPGPGPGIFNRPGWPPCLFLPGLRPAFGQSARHGSPEQAATCQNAIPCEKLAGWLLSCTQDARIYRLHPARPCCNIRAMLATGQLGAGDVDSSAN